MDLSKKAKNKALRRLLFSANNALQARDLQMKLCIRNLGALGYQPMMIRDITDEPLLRIVEVLGKVTDHSNNKIAESVRLAVRKGTPTLTDEQRYVLKICQDSDLWAQPNTERQRVARQLEEMGLIEFEIETAHGRMFGISDEGERALEAVEEGSK